MSVSRFDHLANVFDLDALTVLGEVYDRACSALCGCRQSGACDAVANRIIVAAMKGERDPHKLWLVAINAH